MEMIQKLTWLWRKMDAVVVLRIYQVGLLLQSSFVWQKMAQVLVPLAWTEKCKNTLNATLGFSRQVFVLLLVQGAVAGFLFFFKKWPRALVGKMSGKGLVLLCGCCSRVSEQDPSCANLLFYCILWSTSGKVCGAGWIPNKARAWLEKWVKVSEGCLWYAAMWQGFFRREDQKCQGFLLQDLNTQGKARFR